MKRFAAFVLATAILAAPAAAATYTVTNTADTGAGSLRQAIADANGTPGVPDTIAFNIRVSTRSHRLRRCRRSPTR